MTGKPTKTLKAAKQPPADMPAEADKKVIKALHNLSIGVASDHQQKMALQWIINEASRAHNPQFRSGDDGRRNTDFALGRAFVGQQIIGLLKINLIALTGEEDA